MLFSASRSITVASCCCTLAALLLPSYSEADEPTIPSSARDDHAACQCGTLLTHLEDEAAKRGMLEAWDEQEARTAAAYKVDSAPALDQSGIAATP